MPNRIRNLVLLATVLMGGIVTNAADRVFWAQRTVGADRIAASA